MITPQHPDAPDEGSLFTCGACGTTVTLEDEVCPDCGRPLEAAWVSYQPRRGRLIRVTAWALVLVLVGTLLAASLLLVR